jgi:peptide/nickel transport system substrate-binding protein
MFRISTLVRPLLAALLVPALAACASPPPAAPSAAAPGPTAPPTLQSLPASGLGGKPSASPAAATSPSPSIAAGTPKRGGSFTEAATSDAVSFHPYLTTDTASSSYEGFVYGAGLWRYNPETLQPEPDAARSWTIADDRLTYTFKLRDDLKWSDGQPLTSADYKFAYDQAVKPENKYPYISNLELIDNYEAPDPRTLVIKMNDPIVVGLEAAEAITPLPKHIWEKLDWTDPTKNPEIMAPTVSSGPFKLLEWKKDDHATFVANDFYYRGRPNLDSYTVRVVPSSEIAFQMLKSGEVDYTTITPDQYADAKAQPNLAMYEYWPARAAWSYIGFNLRRPLLQDVAVRHALAQSVDRVAIAAKIQNDLAQPNASIFPPTSWVHNPNVPKWDYDPAKARAELDAAGWKVGPDGMRQVDGKPVKLQILFGPNTNKTREKVATVLQQWLRDVGVDSEIQSLEWGAYLATLKQEPFDYDLYLGAWSATIEPHWMNQIWLEESIPDLNAGAYVNKKVEELFAEAVKEFDLDKRKALYGQIQQIIAEDSPLIFTTYTMSFEPINKRIGGVEVNKLGLSDVETWYVK